MDKKYEHRGRWEIYLSGPNTPENFQKLYALAATFENSENRYSTQNCSLYQEEIKPKSDESKQTKK